MQPARLGAGLSGARPFSILGRIGGDATSGVSTTQYRIDGFQYPRSDRRRCNIWTPRPVGILQFYLSVSSVGSEAMQPWLKQCIMPDDQAFSILGRIGGDATDAS